VLFVLISFSPIRVKIAQAIPLQLRSASAVGIGLFLTFIGLKNAGFVVAHPVTFVSFGKLSAQPLLSLVGLFVTIFFMRKKHPFAFLSGIFLVTLLAWMMGLVKMPQEILSMPDFSTVFFKLDFLGALKLSLLPAIVAIFFTDLFDSLSTFIGVSQACHLTDKNGDPKNMREGLLVDAYATMFAGLLGTSSGTAYIESAAGIEAGGRTGKASIVTAFCFLPFLFIAPLAGIIPAYATAPVLILVGFLMFKSVNQLSLERLEEALPAFITIILIPLTFSITQGIIWGFVSHVLCFIIAGRAKEIKPMMYAIAGISILLLAFENYK
jgi:AGZA family xanthine/uracil permease-like MFS transporter